MNWPHCMSHSVYLFVAHRSGKRYKTMETTTTRLRNSFFPRAVKAISPPTATPAQMTPPRHSPSSLGLRFICTFSFHTYCECFFLLFWVFLCYILLRTTSKENVIACAHTNKQSWILSKWLSLFTTLQQLPLLVTTNGPWFLVPLSSTGAASKLWGHAGIG